MTSPRHASARFLTEKSPTKDAFQGPYMYPASQTNTATVAGKRRPATVNVSRRGRSYSSYATRPSPRTSPQGGQQYPVQDVLVQLHDEDARPLTWQKILDAPVVQEDIPISPRPTSPRHVALTPLPKKGHTARRMSPVLFFWVSVVTVLLLSLSGAFGVFVSFGRGIFGRAGVHAPTLQASSNTVAIGATLTLHGSNFSPHGRVGLTRDAILPIADTGGASIIQADSNGNFTDTVTITPDWQAGTHTINAEDAKLHKIARFSLIVTGKSTSLRPAHFAISTTTLDFGAGDIATNSTQKLTLSNTGGGQITWQASTDQPWLLLTPDNGTFAAGAKVEVTVAVDRSNLHLGTYNAQMNFLSNVGSTKVSVAMQVIPLDPGHDAVLQVSPAVLSFTAPDGGAAPPAQVLTVRNPGVRPLQWAVSTNAPWLSVSPNSGSVQNTSSTDSVSNATIASGGAFQNVNVNVDTSSLLPGTYSGIITFQGQGTEQVKDSPQNVLVTITITPQCGLQVSPFLLTFASVYGQSSPASKTLNVSVSQSSCTTPIQWSATTTASWLVLSTSSGTTPVYPSVSVNTAGLMPGTYTGSIVFSTASGTETLPVTFTLGQTATPIMSVASTALTFNGVIGQPSPGSQSVVVTNTGSGTLNWQATVATSVGGNWLSLAPAGGSLGAQQSTTLAVTVTQLRTLPPGIYNGMITLTGNDGAGHGILGSPQLLSVSFVVQASCTVTTGPSTLTFATTVGQSSSATQPITIAVSGACTHATAWTVTPSASKNWLVATPATGIATASSAGKSNIGVVATGLAAGNYSSALTITAIDSVTHQAIGAPFGVAVTLTVQPACALQAPSVTTEAFTTIAGQSPAAQTFSLAVGGVCTGNVTITPTIALGSGTGWLTVTPATATVLSGGTARFTVTVNGTAMKAGSYGGSITLVGVNNGVTIAGSPQTVGITVTVSSSASLSASAGKAGSNGTNGVTAQPVNIANTGGTVLSWTATIANAPSFVSLSPVSGTLAAGTNTTTGVVVDAAKATAGRYKADVTITATDPATGLAAVGSPTTVRITILIAPPSMQVNTTNMTFSTPVGTNPATQSINITNIGGGTLTWTVGTPSASWLTVSPTSGSDAPNITSSPTFSVDVTGLAAGTYTATVSITPSAGSAVTVTATLTVAAVTPSPTPTVGITPTPTPTVGVTPTPTAQPTPSPTPTAQPTPTVGVTPTPTAQPTPSPTPTVSVTPTPTANVILSPTPTAGVTPTVQPTPNPTPTEAVKPTPTPTPTP